MLTRDQLNELYPRAIKGHIDSFLLKAPALFAQHGIDKSRNRMSFFLAQIGHESGGLSVVEENLNYSAIRLTQVFPNRFATIEAASECASNPLAFGCTVYGGRLGNDHPPSQDGYKYRGRGYIQLTGKNNYKVIGNDAGIPDLVARPDLAASAEHALSLACAFWSSRNLNQTADDDDYVRCTKKINGATIGMVARRNWLDKARRVLAEAPRKQPDAATVLAVQKELLKRGYRSIGASDGLLGRNTSAAIDHYREVNSLGAGGLDDKLLDTLGVRV